MTELICLDGTFSTQNIVLGKALDGHKAATVTPTSNVINQVPFFGGGGGVGVGVSGCKACAQLQGGEELVRWFGYWMCLPMGQLTH